MQQPKMTNPAIAPGEVYRYENFTSKLLLQDLRFGPGAIGPGGTLPQQTLRTADGGTIHIGGESDRPLLLVTGSITCPMTASAIPVLKRLHDDYRDRVDFVLLNTREAHPGEHFPQARSDEQKAVHARALRERYAVPFTIAVDALDGELHQRLDGKPNAAFLLDTRGQVVFRAHWARDDNAIRTAMETLLLGADPTTTESRAMLLPVARAMGSVDEVMRLAGYRAQRDLWLSAFPMALAGAVARLFRFRRSDHRGIAAVATLTGLITLVVGSGLVALL